MNRISLFIVIMSFFVTATLVWLNYGSGKLVTVYPRNPVGVAWMMLGKAEKEYRSCCEDDTPPQYLFKFCPRFKRQDYAGKIPADLLKNVENLLKKYSMKRVYIERQGTPIQEDVFFGDLLYKEGRLSEAAWAYEKGGDIDKAIEAYEKKPYQTFGDEKKLHSLYEKGGEKYRGKLFSADKFWMDVYLIRLDNLVEKNPKLGKTCNQMKGHIWFWFYKNPGIAFEYFMRAGMKDEAAFVIGWQSGGAYHSFNPPLKIKESHREIYLPERAGVLLVKRKMSRELARITDLQGDEVAKKSGDYYFVNGNYLSASRKYLEASRLLSDFHDMNRMIDKSIVALICHEEGKYRRNVNVWTTVNFFRCNFISTVSFSTLRCRAEDLIKRICDTGFKQGDKGVYFLP